MATGRAACRFRPLVRRSAGLVLGVLVSLLAGACVEEQCLAACGSFEGVRVELSLGVDSTYDVELVLDGVPGAFTCSLDPDAPRWAVTDRSGEVPVSGCRELGFEIQASPVSMGVSVNAEDGWSSSVALDPTYTRPVVCGNVCPPIATVTLPVSACTEASDAAAISDPSFESEVYEACLQRESYDPEPVAACLEEEPPGLSPACATCYGLWTECSTNCIEPCVVTPNPGACQSCLDRANCVPEFEACSGLEEPFPGSD